MDVSFNSLRDKPQMVFIMGGPGSGKGTQSAKLVRDFKYTHLSVGDLMRAEIASKSKEGQEVEAIVKKGDIVPHELTTKILVKAIKAKNAKKYIIDGFPRNLEQALHFEKTYREIDFIVNLVASEDTMTERLLKRGLTEGRDDDNIETIKHRIQVFNEQTTPALDFYARHGKVVNVPAEGTIDEVYQLTSQILQPNLTFFYGPPASGQEQLAEQLASLTGHNLIKVTDFYRAQGISNASDEIKMDQLVAFLRDSYKRNFILHNFPENIRQVKIFVDHFAAPKRFFYFDFTRDQVENHIKDRPKQQRQAVLLEYDNYVKNRKDILKYFNNKPYFIRIHESETQAKVWESLVQSIAPEVIVCPQIPNDEFSENYIKRIQQERGYVYLDVLSLVQDEIKRGTEQGRRLASGQKHIEEQVNLIKVVLFADPNKKKFILGGFPDNIQALEYFEKNCCQVRNVIAFTHKALELNGGNIYAHYHAQGKLIRIFSDHLDQFDKFVTKRCKYGFLIGPDLAGRPAIATYLKNRYVTQVVDYNQTTELLKVRLSTEDNQVEEVPFPEIVKYFKEEIATRPSTHNILFDNWPFEKDQLATFIKSVGAPNYVFWLNANEETLGKRYMIENKAEQVDEGDQEKINEELGKTKQFAQVFQDSIAEGNNIDLFDIKVGISTESTLKDVNNIIYKKVFVFQNNSTKNLGLNLQDFMVNACISNNVTFIDVAALVREHLSSNDELGQKLQAQATMIEGGLENVRPSQFTPALVTELIAKTTQTNPSSKYLMLYNYPGADTAQESAFYPRPIDELHQIEVTIGPVKQVISIRDEPEGYVIEDPLEYRPPPEEVIPEVKPPKPEGEEEEEAEPEPPKDEDEEDAKPKFNPLDYQWTVSDGNPKSLAKVYHRRFNCEHVEYQLSSNDIGELDNLLRDSIARFEEGEHKDKDYYVEVILS